MGVGAAPRHELLLRRSPRAGWFGVVSSVSLFPLHSPYLALSPHISPYLAEQAWAEGGASFGLCVLLRTKADRLQVTLGGRTLCSVAPPDSAPLRARTWRPMRVHHARRDAGDPDPTPTPTPGPNPNP